MRQVVFSPKALQQLNEWKLTDPKMLAKIISLVIETASTPFSGTGKPEALKYNYKGKWSRRSNQEHRLVYEVKEEEIYIASCRYHYE